MKTAELNRRIASMTPAQLDTGTRMVRDGYGAHGITLESTLTMKQANACFEVVARDKAVRA